MKKKKLLSQSSSSRLFLALGDRIWEQFNVGPLGFASTFGEGDIVKQDFIAVDGRADGTGNKKAGCIFNITPPRPPPLFI